MHKGCKRIIQKFVVYIFLVKFDLHISTGTIYFPGPKKGELTKEGGFLFSILSFEESIIRLSKILAHN